MFDFEDAEDVIENDNTVDLEPEETKEGEIKKSKQPKEDKKDK